MYGERYRERLQIHLLDGLQSYDGREDLEARFLRDLNLEGLVVRVGGHVLATKLGPPLDLFWSRCAVPKL